VRAYERRSYSIRACTIRADPETESLVHNCFIMVFLLLTNGEVFE